ncbi:N-acetylglucosamine-6-phosphate deacetylase [Cohnella pontilimi]|nr:N-acetylglucosamine-6-phosphate deacetylase [Cohnella pontilimi]
MSSTVWMNGSFYTEQGVIENGYMRVSADGLIQDIGPEFGPVRPKEGERFVDLQGRKVIPGLIDVHVHGGNGFEVMKPAYEQLDGMSRYFAAHGTTTFLATTASGTQEEIVAALHNIRKAMSLGVGGAEIAGVHLEGPFLNDKRRGAFQTSDLRPASIDEMRIYLEAAGGAMRLVTLAPEIPGGFELAAWLLEQGVQVSIGHSDATFEEVKNAVALGCRHTTHHFNGMRPLHHRDPGVAGAGLMIPELTTELIADGVHVHPAVVKMLFDVKTPKKVCVITDSVVYAGLPDGVYGGSTMAGGMITLTGSDTLAGSTLTMIQALRNVIDFTGLPLETVLAAFTLVPAAECGAANRKGSLNVGKDADFLILDGELQLHATYVKGKAVYQRTA